MVNDNTRIAIIGGRGMLGTDLTNICKRDGFDVKVFDLPEFDITDFKQLREAIEYSKIIIKR